MKVTVVFDKNYGDRAQPRVGDAFWLVESPANRALADQFWKAGGFDPNSAVFKDNDTTSEPATSMFDTVDLHHPEWTEIEFVGAPLTDRSRQYFMAEGFSVTATELGFLLTR